MSPNNSCREIGSWCEWAKRFFARLNWNKFPCARNSKKWGEKEFCRYLCARITWGNISLNPIWIEVNWNNRRSFRKFLQTFTFDSPTVERVREARGVDGWRRCHKTCELNQAAISVVPQGWREQISVSHKRDMLIDLIYERPNQFASSQNLKCLFISIGYITFRCANCS